MKMLLSLMFAACLSTAAYAQVEVLAAGAAGGAAAGTAGGAAGAGATGAGATGAGTAAGEAASAAPGAAQSAADKAQAAKDAAEQAEEKAFEKSKKRWEFLKTFLGDLKTMIKDWSPTPITTQNMLEEIKLAKELMPTLPEAKRTESPTKPVGLNGLLSREESGKVQSTPGPESFDTESPAGALPKRAELLKGRRQQPTVTVSE